VTRGMLAALPPAEQRALLAHERSHLRHRHSLLVALARLAGAANPLLAPVTTAVGFAVERWADEDAAAATDRKVAARAVARAALSSRRGPGGVRAALAMAGGPVVARTEGLLAGPPPARRGLTALLIAMTLLAGGSAVAAAHTTEVYFDLAQAAVHR
jgi:beta-lactamase regulating signal transducer with metallopeptidase domain